MEENNPDTSPENEHQSTGEFIKKYAKRAWEYIKKAKMELIVMVALFALDLISKAIIDATAPYQQTITVIPHVLSFYNTHNYNAAFGNEFMKNLLGSMGSRILFSVFAVAASVVFMIILVRAKNGNKLFRVSLAMLIAGAMGNCIDRMFLGFVRDFINLDLFTLITGGWWKYTFNIADAELVIGVILVVIYFIFMYHDKVKEHDETDDVTPATEGQPHTAKSDGSAVGDETAVDGKSGGTAADNDDPEETADATSTDGTVETETAGESEPIDAETKIRDEKEGDA